MSNQKGNSGFSWTTLASLGIGAALGAGAAFYVYQQNEQNNEDALRNRRAEIEGPMSQRQASAPTTESPPPASTSQTSKCSICHRPASGELFRLGCCGKQVHVDCMPNWGIKCCPSCKQRPCPF